jgi:fumarate reductase flavoprotein subunit
VGSQRDVDVLVIGSGAAGLAAALAAHEQGARRVLVAEPEGVVGGSSRLSGGVVLGSGSRLQKAAGIEDDTDRFFRDYLVLNRYGVKLGPVRTLTRRAGETVDWLQGHGVPFSASLIYAGVELSKRGHCVRGGGQAIIDALHSHCRRVGVDIALGQRVSRLLTEGERVTGAAVGDDTITADAVVLATGGFGADPQKVARYFPSAWYEGWSWYIGADGARGDALDFAGQAGAQLTGWGNGLRTLAPNFAPHQLNEAFQPSWAVLLDQHGRRFVDESLLYGVMDQRIRAVGDKAFMMFDDTAMRPSAELADSYRNPYRQNWPDRDPFRPKNYVADLVDDMVAKGRMFRADTIPALAAAAGLDQQAVTDELARYNRMATAGEDRDQLKPARFLLPLAQPPYYAAEVRPCTVNWTGYGLRIDADCRVLHSNGTEIQGLYAAGECTGGVLGPAYLGSGNSLSNSCTMGRVAGETAAAYATARSTDTA